MSLAIQPVLPADVESLLVLMRHMQRDDPWSEPVDETRLRANISELLADDRFGLVYLVREDCLPVAYLVVCFDYSLEYRGIGAWVDELFVEPSHRGKGIATRLLDLAESTSREHGAQFLHLEVNHGNSAIELYRRRGFVDHQRYLMSKSLSPQS